MTTFSQLVDVIVRETHRPDLLPDIADYLNQTIRELHFTPDRGNAVAYRENLRELQLIASSDTNLTWEIPNPAIFQQMQAVRYDTIQSRDVDEVYARETVPGRASQQVPYRYYRAGGTYVFSNFGGRNATVSLAYYEYPRRLKYYETNVRPATYDEDFGWDYATGFDVTPELQLDARNLTSNWLLLRWVDVVSEGLRAKVYKRVSDDSRARTCYSLYSQLRQGLYTSEISTGGSLR